MRIGVISDTHGLLRPQAIAALRGSDRILHAGDVGKPEVLEELATIAPLTAIRGNVDTWATDLPDVERVELAGRRILVVHDVKTLEVDPAAERIDVVISGHSHKPAITRREGVLYLNPGSAGPRRFKLPIAVARLSITARRVGARIIELEV